MTEMREKIARAASQAVERSIDRLKGLHDYASRPAWDTVVAEEIEASVLALIEPVMEGGRECFGLLDEMDTLSRSGESKYGTGELMLRVGNALDKHRAALSPKSEKQDG